MIQIPLKMPKTVTHLSASEPLPEALACHLSKGQDATPWDLTRQLVIVPTRQAGRRLRESLAIRAASQGTGVLPPAIVTQEWLLTHKLPENTAAVADLVATWVQVLLEADQEMLAPFFPNLPGNDGAWAISFARKLHQLQVELATHAIDFQTVARKTSGTEMDPERWACLADLEKRQILSLSGKKLLSPFQLKLQAQEEALPPSGIDRIIVANLVDPIPVLLRTLERWAEMENITVDIVSHTAGPDLVDEWGRPAANPSDRRILPLETESCQIHSLANTAELADMAATFALSYKDSPGSVAFGMLDPQCTPFLEGAFQKQGMTVHNPAGRPLSDSSPARLLLDIAKLGFDSSPSVLSLLAAQPLLARFFIRSGWIARQAELLTLLDDLHARHLPDTLDTFLAFAELARKYEKAIHWFRQTRDRLQSSAREHRLHETFSHVLRDLLKDEPFPASDHDSARNAEAVQALADILESSARAEARFKTKPLPPETWMSILENNLSETKLFDPRPTDAVEMQGWLELSFEDAPHIVLLSFNEGIIPKSIHSDAFLPDSLRKYLGIPSNRDRYARDLLLLETLVTSRRHSGRVDIIVPRTNTINDPVLPSRLLFTCEDDHLVERTRKLFSPPPAATTEAPRTIPWKLAPPAADLPKRHSPSSIRSYLACPTRYYLVNILGMEAVDIKKSEMDALDFGNLCHNTLEKFSMDETLAHSTDRKTIEAALEEILGDLAFRKWGPAPGFPVQVQIESAKARLRAFAEVELQSRLEGWHCIASEYKWEMTLGGHRFAGRIDRIDRNDDGRIRVLDYKTFDTAEPPEKYHHDSVPGDDPSILKESIFLLGKKNRRWTDLQLPLYILALKSEYGDNLDAGYFLLPKTKEDTRIAIWETLSPDLLDSAEKCAVAVADAIAEGRFWPPSTKYKFLNDPLSILYPDGIERNLSAPGVKTSAA